ncbi:MAG: alpha-galactosidase, partial [Bacteroidetes bacterium]
GIPVLDVWRSDYGIAVGHTELVPRLVSTPVNTNKNGNKANFQIEYEYPEEFEFYVGDTLKTYETFVTVHEGDCFSSLNKFTNYMQAKGIKFVEPEESAFEPIWCAWGYERNFTIDEIIGTLPKVKELGIKWVVIDDGFQIAEGDWNVNKEKFPNGNKQMKGLVDKIHSAGLKAKLWWAPLAADPWTDFVKNNPDAIIKNEEEVPRFITWWDAYYMSPTSPKTIEHTKQVVDLFINDWGFDGLKMDGQHMNAVPPNENWLREDIKPIEDVEKLPNFFKMIYDEVAKTKKNAVIENCPCGTCMSYYNMPYMNQAVSSDPESSWQIRLKGKVYKALIGKTAYYGDHVELSDDGTDFASSFGIGAVLGTKFTWPKDNPTAEASYLLTPEKEIIWKKWFSLYNEKMLSKEPYLGNLYDIGFDKPETHAIQKGNTIYYAFYAENWKGKIELRGLGAGDYKVYDYFNEKDYGKVSSESPQINVEFSKFLLLEVSPE